MIGRACRAYGPLGLVGICLAVYAVVLHGLTLTGSALTIPEGAALVNLVPFRTIIGTVSSPLSLGGTLYVLVGNLLMLSPLAIAAVALKRQPRRLLVLALLAAVAVSIETAQFTLEIGRSADVDDVMLNALGAWTVYLVTWRWLPRLRGWAWPAEPARAG